MENQFDFRRFFYSKTGIVLTSIIWGLGLAALFRRVCKNRSCIIMKAPNPEWMKKQVMEENNTCYRMIPKLDSCDKHEDK
jgi:hypothetical protein